jgi:hypothetical protein
MGVVATIGNGSSSGMLILALLLVMVSGTGWSSSGEGPEVFVLWQDTDGDPGASCGEEIAGIPVLPLHHSDSDLSAICNHRRPGGGPWCGLMQVRWKYCGVTLSFFGLNAL